MCDKCKGVYVRAKSKKSYHKVKKSVLKNQPNRTDQTQQVQTNTNSTFEFPSASSGNNIYIYWMTLVLNLPKMFVKKLWLTNNQSILKSVR